MQSKRTGMVAQLRQMWRQHRLRMGLGLCSAIVLATVLVIPITRSSDDEILLYPLPDANYGTLLRVTGSAPPGQTVRIEANHGVVAKTRANESGDFAVAVALPAGAHAIQAIADGLNVHPLASAVYPVRQVSPITNGTSPIAAKTTPTAARGEFTAMAAAAPTIATPPATTTNNPITLSGSAPALAKVGFYVNGRFTREVIAAANGTYSTWVPLEDGLNSVYAVATDNTGASPASNTVQTTYTNSLPRAYGITSITTPTVWTAGSAPIYTLNGALTIASGATLWIQPGVTVKVSGAYKILANGSLVVRGTSTARTVLRPTQVLCTDTSPRRSDWPGVEAGTASGSVSLEYADIYCATNGVYFNLGNGSLAYTRVLNGDAGVRTLSTAGATTLPPQIVGQNELRGNVYGVYVGAYSSPAVNGNNLITGNTNGIYVNGGTSPTQNPVPVVTGNSVYANSNSPGSTIRNYSATNFINPATTILNAQGNWWGTADPSAILATIEDRNTGGSTRPYVNYGGFLGAAGGTSAYTGPTLIGPITANTTLAAGSYLMLSDIVVNATRTWTIAPGAEIRAAAGRKILVNGTLTANGSSTQRARFGSAKPYPAKNDWIGIEVPTGGIANLNYARIEHAVTGVSFNSGGGTITHSLIRFCDTAVYVGPNTSPTINQGNEISNNAYGIYVKGHWTAAGTTAPVVNGNSLFANSSFNYYSTSFADPKPTLNATGNWWGTAVPASIAATISAVSGSAPVNTSGYLAVEPFLPAITLTGFSMSTQEAKPLASIQPAAGTFTLNRAGTVMFKVVRDADSVAVRQWSQSFVVGQNAFTWDGRNDLAAIVPGGLYRVLLTATNGLDPYDYDAPVPAGDDTPDCTGCGAIPTKINPYLNEFYKVQVRYKAPILGNLRVTPTLGTPFYPIDDVYYPVGYHWLYWDGRGPDGVLLTVAATVWAGDGKLMRPNGVYVFSPRVAITGTTAAPNIEVRSDPFLVASSYEQASKIVYRVSLDALVRVTILPPGVVDPASPSAIVLVNNVTQPAKDGNGNPIDYTAEWRGYNASDPNAALAGAEGAYTFAIEATLPATGQKTLYRGILNIVQ